MSNAAIAFLTHPQFAVWFSDSSSSVRERRGASQAACPHRDILHISPSLDEALSANGADPYFEQFKQQYLGNSRVSLAFPDD